MAKSAAFGTKLQVGAAAPGAYFDVGQVTRITGPGLSLDTIDVTTHDSTSAWEEDKVGILRNGELSFDIILDPTNDVIDFTNGSAMGYRMKNRTLTYHKLIFPDTTEWAFTAYVNGYEPSAPHDGALTASLKLKLTGVPTLA